MILSTLKVCLFSCFFLVYSSLASPQPQSIQLGGGGPRPVALGNPIGSFNPLGPFYSQQLTFGGPPQQQQQPQLPQPSPTPFQIQQQPGRVGISQNQPILLKQSSLPLQGNSPYTLQSFPGAVTQTQRPQLQPQPIIYRSPVTQQQQQDEEEYEDEEYEEPPSRPVFQASPSPRPAQLQLQHQQLQQQRAQQIRLSPQPIFASQPQPQPGPGPQRFIVPQQQPQPSPQPQLIRRPVQQQRVIPAPVTAQPEVQYQTRQPQVQYQTRQPIQPQVQYQARQPTQHPSTRLNVLGQDSRGKNEKATTPAPVKTLNRFMKTNPDGSMTWGYENEDGTFKEETIGVDCVVRGKYGYVDPDGVKREYEYQQGNPCDKDKKNEEEEEEDEEEDDATSPNARQKIAGLVLARPGKRRPIQQQQIYQQ